MVLYLRSHADNLEPSVANKVKDIGGSYIFMVTKGLRTLEVIHHAVVLYKSVMLFAQKVHTDAYLICVKRK